MDPHERKILYYLLLSAALVAALFTVFLVNLLKHYKRNLRLQLRVNTIELDTLEKERKRIKADLHDEIAPLLATTGIIIGQIQSADTHLHNRAVDNINTLITRLRSISFDLLPLSLSHKGLITAVEELVENLQLCTTTVIYFSYPPTLPLTPNVQLHLYRMISEALYNTIKHAHAQNCNVHIGIRKKGLELSITDDGKGFAPINNGMGLSNIALRTEFLGGRFWLQTSPGNGTSINIIIPLSRYKNLIK